MNINTLFISEISIHDLPRRSTFPPSTSVAYHCNFNPRPPEEVDLDVPFFSETPHNFNPRPPEEVDNCQIAIRRIIL